MESELEKCKETVRRLEEELELAIAALDNQCTETVELSLEVKETKKELSELECKFSLQEFVYQECKESSQKRSDEFAERELRLSQCLHERNRAIQEMLGQLEDQRCRIDTLTANETKFLEKKAQWKEEFRMLTERITSLNTLDSTTRQRSTAFHTGVAAGVSVRYGVTLSDPLDASPAIIIDPNNTRELSDESADETEKSNDTLQRICWFVRHSGTVPLRCSMFKESDGASMLVDECISLRDENNGSCYTSYIHLLARRRPSCIKSILKFVAGVHKVKVITFRSYKVEHSRHFWAIASGIQRASSGLTIETTHPSAANSCLFGRFARYIYAAPSRPAGDIDD